MPLEITIVAISIASWQIQPDVQPVIFLPKLCSRQACHSAMMNGETHSCNITHDRCGDPAADDVFSIQRKYRKSHDSVVKKAAKADLDKLGFKADVTNTFEEWAAWLHVVSPVYFTHLSRDIQMIVYLVMYMNLFGVSEGTVSKLGIDVVLSRLMEKSRVIGTILLYYPTSRSH